MHKHFISALTATSLASLLFMVPAAQAAPVAISSGGYSGINISGTNSRLTITTDASQPETVNVVDSGSASCNAWTENGAAGNALSLTIHAQGAQCNPHVSINVRPGVNLGINIDGPVVSLRGNFGKVALKSRQASLDASGETGEFDLASSEMTLKLNLANPAATRRISVNADTLFMNIGVAGGSGLSYGITAGQSVFHRGVPDGSGPRLEVRAGTLVGSTYAM